MHMFGRRTRLVPPETPISTPMSRQHSRPVSRPPELIANQTHKSDPQLRPMPAELAAVLARNRSLAQRMRSRDEDTTTPISPAPKTEPELEPTGAAGPAADGRARKRQKREHGYTPVTVRAQPQVFQFPSPGTEESSSQEDSSAGLDAMSPELVPSKPAPTMRWSRYQGKEPTRKRLRHLDKDDRKVERKRLKKARLEAAQASSIMALRKAEKEGKFTPIQIPPMAELGEDDPLAFGKPRARKGYFMMNDQKLPTLVFHSIFANDRATFNTVTDLNRYVKHQKWAGICPTCGIKKSNMQMLSAHCSVHSGSKPYYCPVKDCGFRSSTKSSLKYHLKSNRTHEGVATLKKWKGILNVDSERARGQIRGNPKGHSPLKRQNKPSPVKKRPKATEKPAEPRDQTQQCKEEGIYREQCIAYGYGDPLPESPEKAGDSPVIEARVKSPRKPKNPVLPINPAYLMGSLQMPDLCPMAGGLLPSPVAVAQSPMSGFTYLFGNMPGQLASPVAPPTPIAFCEPSRIVACLDAPPRTDLLSPMGPPPAKRRKASPAVDMMPAVEEEDWSGAIGDIPTLGTPRGPRADAHAQAQARQAALRRMLRIRNQMAAEMFYQIARTTGATGYRLPP